jgi:hypothetical protein
MKTSFRAWDKEAKKFFKPEQRLNAMTISITLDGEIIGHPNIGEMTSFYELNQFTTLTDINDKDIYEGDIMAIDLGQDGIDYQLVHFANGQFVIGNDLKNLKQELDYWGDRIYIAGNIYENPDLLIVG